MKLQKRTKRALAIGVVIMLACAGAIFAVIAFRPSLPRAPVAPARLSRGKVDYRQLERRIALLMQDPNMVGLAVGMVEDGRITFVKGYGETVAGSGSPVTPDTVFRWASLSKGVASALIVQLAEAGKVSLDAPLAGMGTTLTIPGDLRRVTIADLLSHRLGLVRNAWDDRLEAGDDPKQIRGVLKTLPPYCPPGTCYTYQNVAFDAASEIVEHLTGRPYADVARTQLFAPLGMANASVGRAGLQGAASWAHPHHRGRIPVGVDDNYYRVPAAGGVNSSIFDLTRWMQAQLGAAPQVLSPHALAAMHQPRVPTPPHGRRGAMDIALADASYGLAWRSFHYAGHTLVGHRGSVDGYGSLILFDPALKSGIVMLWNSNMWQAARLQLEFFDLLYARPPHDWLELPAQPDATAEATRPSR